MAVTVEQAPSIVLDEEYRIVEANSAAAPSFAQHVGKGVFDCFPGTRCLFCPYYNEARRTGEAVEFVQFYDGYVTHVTVVPRGAQLTVSWETLGILDTWTLDGLRSSIDAALARLEEARHELERKRVRRSLHLVEGGA